jgi:hypothetical protein
MQAGSEKILISGAFISIQLNGHANNLSETNIQLSD